LALLGDGKVRELPGGVEQYLELRHAAQSVAAQSVPRTSAQPAATDVPSAAVLREARKDMARIEKQLARLAEREERIHTAMAEAANDHARVLELNGQLRAIVDEREGLELEWLSAAEVAG
jgi:hypothetical protein